LYEKEIVNFLFDECEKLGVAEETSYKNAEQLRLFFTSVMWHFIFLLSSIYLILHIEAWGLFGCV